MSIFIALIVAGFIVLLYNMYARMNPIVRVPLEGNPNLVVSFRVNLNKRNVRIISIRNVKGRTTRADLGAITKEQVELTLLSLYTTLVNEYVKK